MSGASLQWLAVARRPPRSPRSRSPGLRPARLPEGAPAQLPRPDGRPAGLRLPAAPVADRGRLRRAARQGPDERHAEPARLPAGPDDRLRLRDPRRGARVPRRDRRLRCSSSRSSGGSSRPPGGRATRSARCSAAGLASMILFQLVVNVGMVIGIMPITGIPLPFITHGGASLDQPRARASASSRASTSGRPARSGDGAVPEGGHRRAGTPAPRVPAARPRPEHDRTAMPSVAGRRSRPATRAASGTASRRTGRRATLRWCFAYPDLYEIGMSNLGLKILYEVLNERDGDARRALLRAVGGPPGRAPRGRPPLWSLETRRPLARVRRPRVQPRLRARRDEPPVDARPGRGRGSRRPSGAVPTRLVIAGGTTTLNPEPLADFLDAVVLGEGEDVVVEIGDVLRAHRLDATGPWPPTGRPCAAVPPARRRPPGRSPRSPASTSRRSTGPSTTRTGVSTGSSATTRPSPPG